MGTTDGRAGSATRAGRASRLAFNLDAGLSRSLARRGGGDVKAGHEQRARNPRLVPVLAVPTLLLAFLALTAAPALALPTWGIAMTHTNAYGQQGGVDPFTGSATFFDRGSGDNAYTITVKNIAKLPANVAVPGETLSCAPGAWSGKPAFWSGEQTFSYEWLRNGVPIIGAASDEYTVTAADEGAAVQCEVTATIEGGAAMGAAAEAVPVSPAASTALPGLSSHPEVDLEGSVNCSRQEHDMYAGNMEWQPNILIPLAAQRKRDPGQESRKGKIQAHLRRRRDGPAVPGHRLECGRQRRG